MTNQYHATPYDTSATGFYFSTYEDYLDKASNHKNAHGDPVEEYEIQFIDGDLPWCNGPLFNALGIYQANLDTWFQKFEDMLMDDATKVIYVAEYLNYDISEVLDHMDDVTLYQGTAQEYAQEYIEDSGLLDSMPENLQYYFDVEAYARDMVLSGDITEVEINHTQYIAQGG